MLAQAARGVFTATGNGADVEARASADGPALERERCARCLKMANADAVRSPARMADTGEQSERSGLGECHHHCRAGERCWTWGGVCGQQLDLLNASHAAGSEDKC